MFHSAEPANPSTRTCVWRPPHAQDGGAALPIVGCGAPEADAWLAAATGGLERQHPGSSAASGLADWQLWAVAVMAALAAGGILVAPTVTIAVTTTLLVVAFLSITVLRAAALGLALQPAPSDRARAGAVVAAAQAVDASPLPSYAILVPLYREAEVVEGLVAALAALDYPTDRLEISLILEEADAATLAAVMASPLPGHVRIVVVPEGLPRTKPRALNYALQSARGDLVVVYDAEDTPEPDQLKKAVAAFAAGGPGLGCLQARLSITNRSEGFLAGQFTLEYAALFDAILPAFVRLGLPIPLGGTSNHFRREVLAAAGCWDAYNVTEDADLGVRLARQGYRVAILDSTTWEEAPAGFGNWLGQRTRWLKGWMQTWLVHMRRPGVLLRELGPWRFLGFQVVSAAMILSALVHPWFMGGLVLATVTGTLGEMSEGPLLWIGGFNLAAGYLSAMLLGIVAARRRGWPDLQASSLGMPVYWLLISVAAHRAVVELALSPFHWSKTRHRARRVAG